MEGRKRSGPGCYGSKRENLTILTVNARGLQNPRKRRAVFGFLECVHFDVCFLQEVHLKDQKGFKFKFAKEWTKGLSAWGVGGVHSTGVGVLFRGWDFSVLETFSVVQGRVLGVDADWRGLRFRFICVYAPADRGGRREVFRDIEPVCFTNRILVLGGDFNISFESVDDFSLGHLERVVDNFNLVDTFKRAKPGVAGATWCNSRGAASRIDFVFAPKGIKVCNADISLVWFRDHHWVRSVLEVGGSVFGGGVLEVEYECARRA